MLNLIFLFLNLYSSFSNYQLINNPVPMPDHLNIVNYTFILEYKNGQNPLDEQQQIFPKQNLEKIYYESYIFGSNFFICTDPEKDNFLLIDKKYFSMTKPSEEYTFTKTKDLNSDYVYIGYLSRIISSKKQIIVYGQKDNKLFFFNLQNGKGPLFLNLENYDGYVSCKVIEKKLNVCAYSINNKLYLKFFILYFQKSNPDEIEVEINSEIEIRDIIVLFDIKDSKNKILCSKKKDDSENECYIISFSYNYNSGDKVSFNNVNIIQLNKDKYDIYFTFNEDNCNYTIFKSEYLLCCGKTDYIICERRDMELKLIDTFKIKSPGNNRNLTIQKTDDEGITLFYTNKSSEEKYIYKYYIYPPKCNNIYLELSHFQSKSLNLDNLFQRKTNTNYHITFNNILRNYAFTNE